MPPRIALAGATGNLGLPLLHGLLAANHPVTVLTRPTSTTTSSTLPSHPNLTIAPVDFTSVPSLASALTGADVVIAALASSMIGAQTPLIDAAVRAGCRRYIPAAFGLDTLNENCVALPVGALKAAVQEYLDEKSRASDGAFTWTSVSNGFFLDWVLQQTDILLDAKARRATLYNGGEVRSSATLLGDIVKAVLGVVEQREETRNRVVYVHSAVVTQKQLVGYAEEKGGRVWETSGKGTDEMLREIRVDVEKGDMGGAILGSSIVGCLDGAYGCDYTGRDDNELFGVKKMSEGEVRALVHSLL